MGIETVSDFSLLHGILQQMLVQSTFGSSDYFLGGKIIGPQCLKFSIVCTHNQIAFHKIAGCNLYIPVELLLLKLYNFQYMCCVKYGFAPAFGKPCIVPIALTEPTLWLL